MKSIIKKAVLGLALSSCAAFASATAFTSTIFVPVTFDKASTQKFFFFNSQMFDDNDNLIPVSAGDTFAFDYVFTLPDALSSFAFLANADEGGVAFDSAAFGAFSIDDNGTIDGIIQSFSASGVSGGGTLTSASYDLRLTGSFLVDNGTFSGIAASDVADTAAVPEPMSLSLIGLGLAGIAGLRRRKAA